MSKEKDNEKKKKKSQSALEKEIFALMKMSLRAALDAAIDDLLRDFH